MEHYGDVPDGFIIHHKDGNKWNNDITNLELKSRKDHRFLHPLNNQKEIMVFVRSKSSHNPQNSSHNPQHNSNLCHTAPIHPKFE